MALMRVCLVGGSGRLGPHILRALQADPSTEVTVVTRTSSTATFPDGSNVVRVGDEYNPTELEKVFRGHDAVVVSVANAAEQFRMGIAQASIQAGVKHFIPAGYGGNIYNEASHHLHSITKEKVDMIAELKAMETPGWSWTYICTGLFLDFCIRVGFFGVDPKARFARIWDDGKTTFSATTLPGIAAAVKGVLHHPSETQNREVFVSTTELSLNSLLAAEQSVSGTTPDEWTVEHVDSDQQIAKLFKELNERTGFPRMMALGGLALAVSVKDGYEQDFAKLGRLENDLLGVPRKNIEEVVRETRA